MDRDVLAASTRGLADSRVKTWVTLCEAWGFPAWPVSMGNVRAVAASFKRGSYRSADLYFSTVFTHQEHVRKVPVPSAIRKEAKHFCRSIKRGLPGRRLKDAFPFASIAGLVRYSRPQPFGPANVAHVTGSSGTAGPGHTPRYFSRR